MPDLYDEGYDAHRDEPDDEREWHYFKYGTWPPPKYIDVKRTQTTAEEADKEVGSGRAASSLPDNDQ